MKAIAIRCGRKPGMGIAGFTLMELVVVLSIVSLLFVFTIPTSTVLMNNKKREITVERMKNIEAAFANYVAVNKRLPCPADGTDAPGSATLTAGMELRLLPGSPTPDFTDVCHATVGTPPNTDQQTGVVPWVTLGLAFADILDGWDRQFTYRAGYGLTQDGALDMSQCDPIGTIDTSPGSPSSLTTLINVGLCQVSPLNCVGFGTGCTQPSKFLVNKGFKVVDAANTAIMAPSNHTGAAYVLISHGENGVGAFSNSQTYVSTPIIGVAGTLENPNHSNGNPVSVNSNTGDPYFRDIPASTGDATQYFDDIIIRPTVFSLIQRAQLGPRTH